MNISMEERRPLLKALSRGLLRLLIRRIREDHAAYMASAYLEDLGYDDCPVCVANRRREQFSGVFA